MLHLAPKFRPIPTCHLHPVIIYSIQLWNKSVPSYHNKRVYQSGLLSTRRPTGVHSLPCANDQLPTPEFKSQCLNIMTIWLHVVHLTSCYIYYRRFPTRNWLWFRDHHVNTNCAFAKTNFDFQPVGWKTTFCTIWTTLFDVIFSNWFCWSMFSIVSAVLARLRCV